MKKKNRVSDIGIIAVADIGHCLASAMLACSIIKKNEGIILVDSDSKPLTSNDFDKLDNKENSYLVSKLFQNKEPNLLLKKTTPIDAIINKKGKKRF